MSERTSQQKSELVQQIEQRPFLYDKTEPGYKDNGLRSRAYEEIGSLFDITGPAAEQKWNSLRGQYLRYLNKKPKSGAEGGKKKPWFLATQFAFLDKHLKKRDTESNMPEMNDGDTEEEESAESQSEVSQESNVQSPPASAEGTPTSAPERSAPVTPAPKATKSQKASKRIRKSDDDLEQLIISQLRSAKSEEEAFGRSTAAQLEKLSPH